MSAEGIRKAIEVSVPGAKARSLFEEQSDAFGTELLDFTDVPASYFELLTDVLSDPTYFRQPGAEYFLSQAGYIRDELSPGQRAELFALLVRVYPHYDQEDLCFVAGDFVARQYPPLEAVTAVEKLSLTVANAAQRVGLLLALDVLELQSERPESFREIWLRAYERLTA